jgi:hypothetical protein
MELLQRHLFKYALFIGVSSRGEMCWRKHLCFSALSEGQEGNSQQIEQHFFEV